MSSPFLALTVQRHVASAPHVKLALGLCVIEPLGRHAPDPKRRPRPEGRGQHSGLELGDPPLREGRRQVRVLKS